MAPVVTDRPAREADAGRVAPRAARKTRPAPYARAASAPGTIRLCASRSGTRGWQPASVEERRPQHVDIELSSVKRPACAGAGQPDLRRAEEQRIDFIEVVFIPPEDVVERRTVIR